MSERRTRENLVGGKEAEYEKALGRWERAGCEHSDATAELLEARMALKSSGATCLAESDCPLDQAAAAVDLLRRVYCAAFHSHYCATMVLDHTREAFRFAQKRLDCVALKPRIITIYPFAPVLKETYEPAALAPNLNVCLSHR